MWVIPTFVLRDSIFGSDARSILKRLYSYYHECNNTDIDSVKVAFEDLYQRMYGMPLREMARIVYAVCILCREHEEAGLVEGAKVDFRVNEKVQKE